MCYYKKGKKEPTRKLTNKCKLNLKLIFSEKVGWFAQWLLYLLPSLPRPVRVAPS